MKAQFEAGVLAREVGLPPPWGHLKISGSIFGDRSWEEGCVCDTSIWRVEGRDATEHAVTHATACSTDLRSPRWRNPALEAQFHRERTLSFSKTLRSGERLGRLAWLPPAAPPP